MHRKSVVVQLQPRGIRATGYPYKQFALLADQEYIEWENIVPEWAKMNWTLLELPQIKEHMEALGITKEQLL